MAASPEVRPDRADRGGARALVTRSSARLVANLVLVSAGAAAAYVIVTTPPLRRLAGAVTRRWLGASIPLFLMTQARQAWVESKAADN